MKIGTQHECQPESEWVLCADFEDGMPLEQPERAEWHSQVLDDIESELGVKVSDLKSTEHDPNYSEIARRLNLVGFDTYESDNYFEIYNVPVTCYECQEIK